MTIKKLTVNTDVDVDIDLDEFTDEEIQEEWECRFKKRAPNAALEQIYEEFARRGDAPEILRDYLYESIGRILP